MLCTRFQMSRLPPSYDRDRLRSIGSNSVTAPEMAELRDEYNLIEAFYMLMRNAGC